MKYPDSSLSSIIPDGTSTFDAFVKSIALELLASCFTVIPATSANLLPLFQQRTSNKSVTALHAHALYSFAPAAGHQARAPSESSPWPALYTSPEPEDVLAEALSQRRRSTKQSSEHIPSFAGSGWTDGANEPHERRPRHRCCKQNFVFSGVLTCNKMKRNGKPSSEERPRAIAQQKVVTPAVQRIPSIVRLDHTQSTPGVQPIPSLGDLTFGSHSEGVRPSSPDPSVGNRLRDDFDVPQIRWISATPNANNKANSLISTTGVSRGDMVAPGDYMTVNQVRRRSSMSPAITLPQIPFWAEGPRPFSAPPLESDDGYFNMANPAILQDDDHDQETVDEMRPRISVVAHVEPQSPSAREPASRQRMDRTIYNHDNLSFDGNNQTALDRLNDAVFGTETGHDSQQRASSPVRGESANKDDVEGYPDADDGIHEQLISDKGSMEDDDEEPGTSCLPTHRHTQRHTTCRLIHGCRFHVGCDTKEDDNEAAQLVGRQRWWGL